MYIFHASKTEFAQKCAAFTPNTDGQTWTAGRFAVTNQKFSQCNLPLQKHNIHMKSSVEAKSKLFAKCRMSLQRIGIEDRDEKL